MARKKKSGHNTVKVDDVDLSDVQLRTLGAIIDDWNSQSPNAEEKWNANNVLAAMVEKYLDVMEPDYRAGGRKADFTAPPAPPSP